MSEIAAKLDKKYSISSKAAKWGEKAGNWVKAQMPHTPLSPPATQVVDTLSKLV